MRGGDKEKALGSINEVASLKKNCPAFYPSFYKEVGEIFLHRGSVREALTFFGQALEKEEDEAAKITVQFKIAECYRRLNNDEKSLALYNQILTQNHPFWSNLAKERMDEIRFQKEIGKIH